MKTYQKGELRDAIVACCVLGAVLTVETMLKHKQTENTLDTRSCSVNFRIIKQQGKILK